MIDAASLDARNATAAATSSARASGPSATPPAQEVQSAFSGNVKLRNSSVSTALGHTALTRTPPQASSIAIDFVSITTPPFDAQ